MINCFSEIVGSNVFGQSACEIYISCKRRTELILSLKRLCFLLHFVINANYASLFAMKLEKLPVNDKITAWYETNMSLTLQTTKMNFEKRLGYQVFKNQNCNPQISSRPWDHGAARSQKKLFWPFGPHLQASFWSRNKEGPGPPRDLPLDLPLNCIQARENMYL